MKEAIELLETMLRGDIVRRRRCDWRREVVRCRARIRSYIRALRILRAVESGSEVLVPMTMEHPVYTTLIDLADDEGETS